MKVSSHHDLILAAADQLSSLANNVAGFGISSAVFVAFASLQDLGKWVKLHPVYFSYGTLIGGFVYVFIVWLLYFWEFSIRDSAFPGNMPSAMVNVSRALAWARTLGIMTFTIVAMLAIHAALNSG